MTRTAGFVVGMIGSVMAAIIAGLLAALLGGTGGTIAMWSAGTFMGAIGLFMTAYLFLRPPGGGSTAHSENGCSAPAPPGAVVKHPDHRADSSTEIR